VVDAIKQAMGSFVSFTFSTKFVCRVNQILTVIAVIQIQNFRQAFMSKSHDLMSRNVNIFFNNYQRTFPLELSKIPKFNLTAENFPKTTHQNKE
jgi:hypothetical protein